MYKQFQDYVLSIKEVHSPKCQEMMQFFTNANVDGSNFVGLLMRMTIYGFHFDDHPSSRHLLPLKIMLEARRMELAEIYLNEAPNYVEHLVEFLSAFDRFFPKQTIITECILPYLFKNLLDLNLLTLLMYGDMTRAIGLSGTMPAFIINLIDAERDLITVDGENVLLNRQTRMSMFFKSWLYLANNIPDPNERCRYFDEKQSIEENVAVLVRRVAEANIMLTKDEIFKLARAYDCLNHCAKLTKQNFDLSVLRREIIKLIREE